MIQVYSIIMIVGNFSWCKKDNIKLKLENWEIEDSARFQQILHQHIAKILTFRSKSSKLCL